VIIRGNIYEYGEQISIRFKEFEFPSLDDVLRHCYKYFNNIDEIYIYELIVNSKVYYRREIEKLWERMGLCLIGNNFLFRRTH
jgi:hypothetical protein